MSVLCLDGNSVLSYIDSPPSDARVEVERHLDECSACRQLVAAALQADSRTAPTRRDAAQATRVDGPSAQTRAEGSGPRQGGATLESVTSQPMNIEEGAHVGRFRIVRRLGAGGMGEVYVGYDTQLGRKVALKVIRPELVASDEALRRFYVEARATAKFDHPHIVKVYEGSAPGFPPSKAWTTP